MTEDNKSIIEFPCRFPIKIFGENSENLTSFIRALFSEKVDDNDLLNYKQGQSKKGKYLAITVTINAQSQCQLDEIYHALTKCPLVKMAL